MALKFVFKFLSIALVVLLLFCARSTFAPSATGRVVFHQLESLVARYGYPGLLVVSFLGGLPLIGIFVPSCFFLVAAAVIADRGAMSRPLVIASASAGFSAAFFVDFALGRFGRTRLFKYVGL